MTLDEQFRTALLNVAHLLRALEQPEAHALPPIVHQDVETAFDALYRARVLMREETKASRFNLEASL